MNCILDFQLGSSDTIAIIALLVAGLSALYARWSWAEARKANFISLLGPVNTNKSVRNQSKLDEKFKNYIQLVET